MNCQVCCKKFTSVNNLYKHLQTNKKCLVMTNKNRIHNPEPVNKELKVDMKLTPEEYNILMMYRCHRLQFEILPQDTHKNVDQIHVEKVVPLDTQVEVVPHVVDTQVEATPEVVEAQVEPVPEVVEAQVEAVSEVVEAVPEVVEAQESY